MGSDGCTRNRIREDFTNGEYEYGEPAIALMKELDYVRVAGTSGERQGAEIIRNRLSAMGLDHKTEVFKIDAYDIKEARLQILSPIQREFTVTGYGCSGSTEPEGITAPFLYAEDGNDILFEQSKGKIVLLNDHPAGEKNKKLVESGAVGFITISGRATDEEDKTDLEERVLRNARHLKHGEVAKLPGVCIRAADAMALLEAESENVRITLVQKEFQAESCNIIAEIEGTDKNLEWVTLGAHYDSVPFSHGMFDNAAGSVTIMEACKYFLRNKPRRSLRFVWFGAEEQGLLGSLHHVAANTEAMESTKLMINADLGGQIIGDHHAVVTGEESVCGVIKFIAQETGFGISVRQDIFSSDSSSYADKGIPAVSFYRSGTIGHSRYDTIDLVSERTLDNSIQFFIKFSEKIINSEIFPIPHNIPDTIKEKLAVYFDRKPAVV